MKLHEFPNEFRDLISIVAANKHLPESAIERDYFIVMILSKLEASEYAEDCVFKGGTSLSKCYPGSIERFSEDIDLTYLGKPDMSDKAYGKNIKKIEDILTDGFFIDKIEKERNNRNKSAFVWFDNKENKVKLEIGSSVRPEPYSKKSLKTYIQEFLEEHNGYDDIERFELSAVTLNVLNIERTFVDKIMAVKRHSICGNIELKIRHVYDVARLFDMPEIKSFVADKEELKRLIRLTKETDAFYLTKRNISKDYDPKGDYDFEKWKANLNLQARSAYELLHKDLLYTDEKQDFDKAMNIFSEINVILKGIGE